MTIEQLYEGAERLINEFLRKEIQDQGHHLTGALESSLESATSSEGKAKLMEGFAANYMRFVNDGFPASSASMKQWPFIRDYFIKRGLSEKEAGAAAAATIKKWMSEGGMPTQASKRFSSTGSRTHLVENAFVGNKAKIDQYMSAGFDFVVDELYRKEKSETI